MFSEKIEKAFSDAENGISKINQDIINLEGMTGTKTRHFYNNLCSIDNIRYLEIGTWKGSSICSAMFQNNIKGVCIDNWSEFGGPKNEFLYNFNKFKGTNEVIFIEKNCFDVEVSTLDKFNMYMYDGDHKEDSHYKALKHFYDCLDDTFIFIVDDWNWEQVRNGTKKSITDLNFKILYEKEIRSTNDNSCVDLKEGAKNWWNGIYVAVLSKN
jgi:hypothetical protein